MGAARRIYKNTVYLGIADIASKVLQFIVMLYAARLLSREQFGKFSFALSLSFMLIILADLGINTLLIREVSRDKRIVSRYFMNALLAKIMLSFFAFLATVVALNLMSYPSDTKHIAYLICLFTILSTFTELCYSVFRAFEMMFYDALLKITRMVLLTALSLYVLIKGYGVVAFSYTFVLVEIIIVFIAFFIALKKFIKPQFSMSFSFIGSMLKKAIPFGLAFVFGSIYFFIGSVMLSKIKGDSQVAVYSVAYNIALAILFIPTVYTNAIYPALSRYYRQDNAKLKILYEKSFKYLYIIGLPISIGLYLLAQRILFFFYGASYSESALPLQIISWYLFIKFINFLLGIVLYSIDGQARRMTGQGATAAFNVAVNLLLIPKFGYIGAAWATFVTEIFLFAVYYWYVSKSLYFYNFGGILLKPAVAAFAMFLLIKFTNFGLVFTVLFSAISYFAALFLLKALDEGDYAIIKSIFGNEKKTLKKSILRKN